MAAGWSPSHRMPQRYQLTRRRRPPPPFPFMEDTDPVWYTATMPLTASRASSAPPAHAPRTKSPSPCRCSARGKRCGEGPAYTHTDTDRDRDRDSVLPEEAYPDLQVNVKKPPVHFFFSPKRSAHGYAHTHARGLKSQRGGDSSSQNRMMKMMTMTGGGSSSSYRRTSPASQTYTGNPNPRASPNPQSSTCNPGAGPDPQPYNRNPQPSSDPQSYPNSPRANSAPVFPITDLFNADNYHRLNSPTPQQSPSPSPSSYSSSPRDEGSSSHPYHHHHHHHPSPPAEPGRPQRGRRGQRGTPHPHPPGHGYRVMRGRPRQGPVRRPQTVGQAPESFVDMEEDETLWDRCTSAADVDGREDGKEAHRVADHFADNSQVVFLRKTTPNVTRSVHSAGSPCYVIRDEGSYISHLRRVYLNEVRDFPKMMLSKQVPIHHHNSATKDPVDFHHHHLHHHPDGDGVLAYYIRVDVPTGMKIPSPPFAQKAVPVPSCLDAQHAMRTCSSGKISPRTGAPSGPRDPSPELPGSEFSQDGFASCSYPEEKGQASSVDKGYFSFSEKARLHSRPPFFLSTPASHHSPAHGELLPKSGVCGLCCLNMGMVCQNEGLHQHLGRAVAAVPSSAAGPDAAALNPAVQKAVLATVEAASEGEPCSARPNSVTDSRRSLSSREATGPVNQGVVLPEPAVPDPVLQHDKSTSTAEEAPMMKACSPAVDVPVTGKDISDVTTTAQDSTAVDETDGQTVVIIKRQQDTDFLKESAQTAERDSYDFNNDSVMSTELETSDDIKNSTRNTEQAASDSGDTQHRSSDAINTKQNDSVPKTEEDETSDCINDSVVDIKQEMSSSTNELVMKTQQGTHDSSDGFVTNTAQEGLDSTTSSVMIAEHETVESADGFVQMNTEHTDLDFTEDIENTKHKRSVSVYLPDSTAEEEHISCDKPKHKTKSPRRPKQKPKSARRSRQRSKSPRSLPEETDDKLSRNEDSSPLQVSVSDHEQTPSPSFSPTSETTAGDGSEPHLDTEEAISTNVDGADTHATTETMSSALEDSATCDQNKNNVSKSEENMSAINYDHEFTEDTTRTEKQAPSADLPADSSSQTQSAGDPSSLCRQTDHPVTTSIMVVTAPEGLRDSSQSGVDHHATPSLIQPPSITLSLASDHEDSD